MFSSQLFFQLLISGVILGSAYALLAASIGIIYSTTGIFHFAHAIPYAVAAFAAVIARTTLGLPLIVALLVGLAAAILVGVLTELTTYRPLRARGAGVLPIFLASLGLSIAAPKLLQVIFGPENRPLPGFDVTTYAIGDLTLTNLHIVTVTVCWAGIAGLLLFLSKTRYGRATRACQSNKQMSMAVGIRLGRVYLIVFAAGSLLVGVSALLFTLGGVASPTMGLTPVLIGFIGMFLGGIGTVGGAAVGGFVLGMVTSLSGLFLSPEYASVVVFGMLFIVIIVRPQGLLGKAAPSQ
jgi:branched-chain amino acid transport system permease protein